MRMKTIFCLLILGVPILLGFLSTAVQGWHFVFDDAFISFRYAKNLGLGHGLTWNPGEAPTEGYTNFLLVVFLAPFVKAGLDPLLVTRVLSYLCAFAMSVLLYHVARGRQNASAPLALMAASLIPLAHQTRHLCILGLETVIYAFLLLLTFHRGVEFLDSRSRKDSIWLGALIIITMMLRPEAALLYPVLAVFYLIRPGGHEPIEWKPLLWGLMPLLGLGGLYLLWKGLYFGNLLPNPYYIKAADTFIFSKTGTLSVYTFIGNNAVLLALAVINLLFFAAGTIDRRHKSMIAVATGLGFCAVYMSFFMHTDTLMDYNGRFMYPLTPILIYLSIPALNAALKALESWVGRRSLYFAGIVLAFLLTFGPNDISQAYGHLRNITPSDDWQTSNTLMQKEYRVAQSLAYFPDIETVRIAWGDAGVMPYYTDAIWLDPVGLNDTFIARTRDRALLVDYYFDWQPDIAILGSNKDHSWVSYGHGPLGDLTAWSDDPRWDDYSYVGTSITSGHIYDLQYYVRKASRFHDDLRSFMRSGVVDGWYEVPPFSVGTETRKTPREPVWIPRR
jgi:arabinofuranosyltransferase